MQHHGSCTGARQRNLLAGNGGSHAVGQPDGPCIGHQEDLHLLIQTSRGQLPRLHIVRPAPLRQPRIVFHHALSRRSGDCCELLFEDACSFFHDEYRRASIRHGHVSCSNRCRKTVFLHAHLTRTHAGLNTHGHARPFMHSDGLRVGSCSCISFPLPEAEHHDVVFLGSPCSPKLLL